MSVKGSLTTSDFLPYSEYQRLLECLEQDQKYKECAYCILSFCLSLRVSDVLRLKWCDILDERSLIVKEKKTKKVKSIPIGSDASEKLHGIYVKMQCPDKSEYIMKSERTGLPVSRQYINHDLLKSWKDKYQLQIGNFSSHTFRKTFGRYVYDKMGRSQESLIMLQYIFKHHSISTTMRYIGLRDDEVGNIYESIKL